MGKTERYRVTVAESVAQRGRWLEVGAIVELEPAVAVAEFGGRLATLDGAPVRRPGDDVAFEAAVAPLPAHEQATLRAQREGADPARDQD